MGQCSATEMECDGQDIVLEPVSEPLTLSSVGPVDDKPPVATSGSVSTQDREELRRSRSTMASTSRIRLMTPVNVVDAPDLTICEYFGRVASGMPEMSACIATVRKATQEAPQKPDFSEYVLVLEGSVEILHDDGEVSTFCAGQAFFLQRGTRVQWRWPGPCKYVPICLPAFSPTNCGRCTRRPQRRRSLGW